MTESKSFPEEIHKEIAQIQEYLDKGEQIKIVSRQMRFVPGGSIITPNTIFATDKKLIIRNPSMLGLRKSVEYHMYDKIVNIKHEDGRFSSTLVITAPGMGTAARPPKGQAPWGRSEDGMIDGIPRIDAINIVKLVMEKKK